MKKQIATDKAPKAIGPYSQAIQCGEWLYCSGQIPLNPETMELEGSTVAEQGERVLTNLGAVLEAAGTSFENVLKTTVYLSDMANFKELNEVYAKYFTGDCPPARATVAVKELPLSVLVEIDCVAKV